MLEFASLSNYDCMLQCMQAYGSHTLPSPLVAAYGKHGDRSGSILFVTRYHTGRTPRQYAYSSDNYLNEIADWTLIKYGYQDMNR